MRELVDPTKQAFEKRKLAVRNVDGKTQVLCVDFAGTMQEVDIKRRTDLPVDAATGTHPYRFKIDNKALDPEERKNKGLPPFDFSDTEAIIKALGEPRTFDMPLWFVNLAGDDISRILQYDLALIFQSKGCNLHDWTETGGCTYCYVDDVSNNPSNKKNAVWLGIENIINTAEKLREDASVRKGRELHRIRHSGGETTTELDFTLELQKEIEKRDLEKLFVQLTQISARAIL
ncbi:MAG: hypothetical protein V1839_00690 [archaeon]